MVFILAKENVYKEAREGGALRSVRSDQELLGLAAAPSTADDLLLDKPGKCFLPFSAWVVVVLTLEL